MPKLVISPAVDPARLQQIRAAAGTMTIVNAADDAQALAEIADADAFFGKLTPPLLAAARNLRWVQSPTASLEHYMFPELADHPCQLTNMRGLFSDVIADHVFGYILCFARRLHVYLQQQREHRWGAIGGEAARSTFTAGPGQVSAMDRGHQHVSDCTLGIVGVGSIGAEIARRGAAFGMPLLGVDPVRRSLDGLIPEILPVAGLPELLAAADYVVVTAPHTPDTVKLFGAAQFAQMRSSAYFINIGRGAVVDLAALVEALRGGVIAGAALDVFETEPLPPDHALWDLPNVLLTPHVAAASPRIAERHTATFLENLRRYLADEPLFTPVDKHRWF